VGKSRIQDSGFGKKKGRFGVSGARPGFRIQELQEQVSGMKSTD
jgi:hypothetical protein